MQFTVPDIEPTLNAMQGVRSEFNGVNELISWWVLDTRNDIKKNKELLKGEKINGIPSTHDIDVLRIFLRDFLIRAVRGEAGIALSEQLKNISSIADLNTDNFRGMLSRANYRWGSECGAEVMNGVVNTIAKKYEWNWVEYINTAEKEKTNNFSADPMLNIKNVGFKLRDLALSNFSQYYAAFDLHVTRVMTRLGWLNYGFPILAENNFEMGNNPANESNYLFLHSLLISLSSKTNDKFLPVDFDRIFWHFGRTICSNNPKCGMCPVEDCPTGIARNFGK